MAMSGAVTIGDVLMYSGAIITMMTGVQNVLMQYNQINYRNEYLKTYEEFINRPNMHYDGTLPIEKRDDNEYELSFRNVSFCYPGTEDYILKMSVWILKLGRKWRLSVGTELERRHSSSCFYGFMSRPGEKSASMELILKI